MGNVLISMDDDCEALLRQLAQRKYGGKKGSLRRVVQEALEKLNQKSDEVARLEFIARLRKGHSFKYKMYKSRDEIYG